MPGRPLVARELQPELVDELRVGRRAGDGRRPRVRDVGERARRASPTSSTPRSRASSVDELAERPPAVVRLDADEQDRVAVRPGDRARGRTCSRATRSSASVPPRARPSAASPGSRRRARGRCPRTSARPRAGRGSPRRASPPDRRRSSRGTRRSGPAARASGARRSCSSPGHPSKPTGGPAAPAGARARTRARG